MWDAILKAYQWTIKNWDKAKPPLIFIAWFITVLFILTIIAQFAGLNVVGYLNSKLNPGTSTTLNPGNIGCNVENRPILEKNKLGRFENCRMVDISIQQFENGKMLWVEGEFSHYVFILHIDNSIERIFVPEISFQQNDCNPPPNNFQQNGGFCWAWFNRSLEKKMGKPLYPEWHQYALFEKFENGFVVYPVADIDTRINAYDYKSRKTFIIFYADSLADDTHKWKLLGS